MAYIDFSELGGDATALCAYPPAQVRETVPNDAVGLTAIEWSVVEIARRDGRASLRAPTWWSRLLGILLKQPNPMLANARLEALRRMAVLSWHDGYAVPPHELRAFHHAGYTADQYETMVGVIGVAKASRNGGARRGAQPDTSSAAQRERDPATFLLAHQA